MPTTPVTDLTPNTDTQIQPAKKILPLIPLRNLVLFPSVDASLFFGRKESTRALVASYDNNNRLVIITSQKNPRVERPEFADLYPVGVLARIEHILQTDGNIHAIVHGISRVNILSLVQNDPFLMSEFVDLPVIAESTEEIQQSAEALLSQLKKAFALGRQFDLPAMMHLSTGISSSDLADQVAFSVDAKLSEKQQLLETIQVSQRLKTTTEYLIREMQVAELEKKIEDKTQEKFNSGIKRNILEERKHQIELELKKLGKSGEGDMDELETKIKKSPMPKDIKKKVLKEYQRLLEMGAMAPESSYIRTYLETMVEMPWGTYTPDNLDIKKADAILENDHYGLKEVKDRILEHLAVLNLKNKATNNDANSINILCFIGPPGVGKTSIGRSIAKALGRNFVRVSLGGIRDEAEIRGHRRTYVGAMPGRIAKGMKDAKSMNPVFMLDEIDKIGADYRGDPAAALLETLDPEQNKDFTDHYLDVPLDLSKVFFILTGNDLSSIPGPLRDRVEIITFAGYTQEEKFQIAKKYLIKKQLKANGLSSTQVPEIPDDIIRFIIDRYTREAGVRSLERVFANLFRKVAKKVVIKKLKKYPLAKKSTIVKMLGPIKFHSQLKGRHDEIGTSTGLAWTSVGGEILFIEVNIMPGRGQLILTGKLGSVMKESCQAAVSYVRSQASKFGIKADFHKIDIHIHVPEGATPKDGPSAGSAITTALVSALKGVAVPREIGMTGEITLRGNILEIGGLKEKTIAAHQAGLTTVLIPADNKKNLVEVPTEVKKAINFIPVENYAQVYDRIFATSSPKAWFPG